MEQNLKGQWFTEQSHQWPGIACSLEYEEKLVDEQTKYQHLEMYKTKTFGHMMVLDGCIQLTERDELAYHESIVHTTLFSHPNPEYVLIVGGGDGMAIREILKHSCVKGITICEIDQRVIDMSRKYLPGMEEAYTNPKVTIVCDDANKFLDLEENKEKYDCIVSDTSDPEGPASVLFQSEFYVKMYNALKPGGRIITQSENYWTHLDFVMKIRRSALEMYANVEYAAIQIPTYPLGIIGFTVACKAGGKSKTSCKKPARKPTQEELDSFRYYTTDMHSAIFCLPAWVQRAFDKDDAEHAAKNVEEGSTEGSTNKKRRTSERAKKN